jgi:hypothetical protein
VLHPITETNVQKKPALFFQYVNLRRGEEMKDNKIIVKKYPSRAIFKSSTSILKLSKEKEQLLKAIIKEIDRLNQEMEKILK